MKHCQHLKWNITPRHLKSSSCCPFPPFSGSSLKTNRLFSLGVNRTTPYKMKVGRLNGPAVKPRQKGVWNACQKRIQVTSGGLSRSAHRLQTPPAVPERCAHLRGANLSSSSTFSWKPSASSSWICLSLTREEIPLHFHNLGETLQRNILLTWWVSESDPKHSRARVRWGPTIDLAFFHTSLRCSTEWVINLPCPFIGISRSVKESAIFPLIKLS